MVQQFADLVRLSGTLDVNEGIIRKAATKLYARISFALQYRDPQIAEEVYVEACKLPQTATEQQLASQGIRLTGGLVDGNASCLNCYKEEGLIPCVLKIPNQNELHRMTEVLSRCKLTSEHIIKTELINSRQKAFVLMPRATTTLFDFGQLLPKETRRLWHSMCDALECLHSQGVAHMDVKPENITVGSDGKILLIDLGSAQFFGLATLSTHAYHPCDFPCERAVPRTPLIASSATIDWWMLAATIVNKGCGVTGWGESATNPSQQQVLEALKQHFPDIWEDLLKRLENTPQQNSQNDNSSNK